MSDQFPDWETLAGSENIVRDAPQLPGNSLLGDAPQLAVAEEPPPRDVSRPAVVQRWDTFYASMRNKPGVVG